MNFWFESFTSIPVPMWRRFLPVNPWYSHRSYRHEITIGLGCRWYEKNFGVHPWVWWRYFAITIDYSDLAEWWRCIRMR